MKHACMSCERTSTAKNLFCPELDCPAELSPIIFDPGERLGDIEIVRTIVTTRSATLYDALHHGERVFVKVAAPGTNNRQRLKRESVFLRSLGTEKLPVTAFPRLRPAYSTNTIDQDPFGMVVVQGELLYFYLTDAAEGECLEALLRKQPQWWVHHVGWLSIELASAVNQMHLRGLFHLGLTPSSVLVRFETKPDVPHILLWDLGVASDRVNLADDWYADYVPPAYLAPELIGGGTRSTSASVRSDVYGLGLVLYEMLVGQPAFSYRLVSDAQVLSAVQKEQRVEMDRVDDVRSVAQVALRAAAADPGDRQATAADVAEQLTALVGPIPRKKKRPWQSLGVVTVLAAVLMLVVLIALAFAMSQ